MTTPLVDKSMARRRVGWDYIDQEMRVEASKRHGLVNLPVTPPSSWSRVRTECEKHRDRLGSLCSRSVEHIQWHEAIPLAESFRLPFCIDDQSEAAALPHHLLG